MTSRSVLSTYFAYYRVSTQKQGVSELDLEAQQAAAGSFLKGGQPPGESIQVSVDLSHCADEGRGFLVEVGRDDGQGQAVVRRSLVSSVLLAQ